MKITCLLTSFNRPNLIRQALKSVESQVHSDYQLIVLDESTVFDVRQVVSEFKFPEVEVHQFQVLDVQRKTQNRLSINLNFGIRRAKGEVICYLCDDDFLYPNWLGDISAFFTRFQGYSVVFGKLRYTNSMEMKYPETGFVRFFNERVVVPGGKLDHNQVAHRNFGQQYLWPEDAGYLNAPDGTFFNLVAKDHVFHPLDAFAAVKRSHAKCLQFTLNEVLSGTGLGIREPT